MRCLLFLYALCCLVGPAEAADLQPSTPYPYHKDNTAGPVGRGDLDCSNVIELQWDETVTYTTVGAPSNIDSYQCSTWDQSGPEMVFHMTVEAADPPWIIDFTPLDVDLDLVLIQDGACDETDCTLVSDNSIHSIDQTPGDFYIIVEGYMGGAGAFELTFAKDYSVFPEPLPSACLDFQQAFPTNTDGSIPAGDYVLDGNTCEDGLNHIQGGCLPWSSGGLDIYYEMVLLPGATIEVFVGFLTTGNAMLYLTDTCGNPDTGITPTFLACVDEGGMGDYEYLTYTNTMQNNKLVYLVVDSHASRPCGRFEGVIMVDAPGAVATEAISWGSMKSRYQ